MAAYLCAVCGALALPGNSDLVDGTTFVHRACRPDRNAAHRDHAPFCVDDGCRGECQSGLYVDLYDPDDREPMGGDPWWRGEREP